MDCYVCLGGGATPVTLRFTNGDASTLYLCESCVDRFELDRHVAEVRRAPTA